MTTENAKVLALTVTDILSVYSGKDGKCCCGCSGKHYYAKALQAEAGKNRGYAVGDDECSDKMIARVLRLVQANVGDADVMLDAQGNVDHVAVVLGGRLYIAYPKTGEAA